jgi:hypothetical protein
MSRTSLLFATLFLCAAIPVLAQPQQQESLGDLARQARAQKDADPRKTSKVFTNDNLPAPVRGEAVTALSTTTGTPSTPASTPSTSSTSPASEDNGSKKPEAPGDKTKTRDYWQGRFKAARHDLAQAREQQNLAEDELNLLQIQQVRELDSSAKADLTAKVQAKQAEVDTDKAAVDAALKVLDDLEKEFKDSGAPEDWSKTDEPPATG